MDKRRIIIIISCILITLAAAYSIYRIKLNNERYITYETFLDDIENGKVFRVSLSDSHRIRVSYKDGNTFITDNPRKDSFKEELLIQGVM